MNNEQQERLNKLEARLEVETLGYELKSAMIEEKEQEIEKLQKELQFAKGREEDYLSQIKDLKEEVARLEHNIELPCDECMVKSNNINDMSNRLDTLQNLLQRHITYGESIDYFISEAKNLLKVME